MQGSRETVCVRERPYGTGDGKSQEEKASRNIWGKEIEEPDISGELSR